MQYYIKWRGYTALKSNEDIHVLKTVRIVHLKIILTTPSIVALGFLLDLVDVLNSCVQN